jgi:transcriptional regulator NrdR family protein
MTYELTNAEKISIIHQHLKNLEYNRYNLEVSILELTSATNPKQDSIEDVQAEIDSIVSQQTALNAEVASLTV